VPRHEPERTCIVTREAKASAGLIRFVLGPDQQVYPDLKHRLPGRGVWVTARRDLVEEAVRRRSSPVPSRPRPRAAPPWRNIGGAARPDLRQALSLANKAGAVMTGFQR
jgi:hypothetical protein